MDGASPLLKGKEGKRRRGKDGSLEPPSPYISGMMTPDGQLIGPDGKVISSRGSSKK